MEVTRVENLARILTWFTSNIKQVRLCCHLRFQIGARPHPLKMMQLLWYILPGVSLVKTLIILIRNLLELRFTHDLCLNIEIHVSVWRFLNRECTAHTVLVFWNLLHSIKTVHFLCNLHLLSLQRIHSPLMRRAANFFIN